MVGMKNKKIEETKENPLYICKCYVMIADTLIGKSLSTVRKRRKKGGTFIYGRE